MIISICTTRGPLSEWRTQPEIPNSPDNSSKIINHRVLWILIRSGFPDFSYLFAARSCWNNFFKFCQGESVELKTIWEQWFQIVIAASSHDPSLGYWLIHVFDCLVQTFAFCVEPWKISPIKYSTWSGVLNQIHTHARISHDCYIVENDLKISCTKMSLWMFAAWNTQKLEKENKPKVTLCSWCCYSY